MDHKNMQKEGEEVGGGGGVQIENMKKFEYSVRNESKKINKLRTEKMLEDD